VGGVVPETFAEAILQAVWPDAAAAAITGYRGLLARAETPQPGPDEAGTALELLHTFARGEAAWDETVSPRPIEGRDRQRTGAEVVRTAVTLCISAGLHTRERLAHVLASDPRVARDFEARWRRLPLPDPADSWAGLAAWAGHSPSDEAGRPAS
jgi:hypothetical protein